MPRLTQGAVPKYRKHKASGQALVTIFTQSASLTAVHPVADALADEFPFCAWFLRAEAFRRFGYDPDGVFGTKPDEYGFEARRPYRIIQAADD